MTQAPVSSQDVLEELAVRLLQAQPDEVAELTELLTALSSVAGGRRGAPKLSASVRKLVRAACDNLSTLVKGEAPNADQALASAVKLVCMATSPDAGLKKPSSDLVAVVQQAPISASEPPHPAELLALPLAPTILPAEADLDLLGEFMAEANEHVVNAEAALLVLEANPDDMASVNTIFRAFHTVKGVSAMLGLRALAELAHHAESLLAGIRDGQIRCTGHHANLCLRAIDMLKETLVTVSAKLKGEDVSLPAGYAQMVYALQHPSVGGSEAPASAVDVLSVENIASTADVAARIDIPPAVNVAPVASGATQAATSDSTEASVRVRTDRLDRLIDMAGELVIAHSMLAQDEHNDASRDPEYHKKFSHAGKIVRELQDMSMSLRMVPMRPTFQKLTRIVRDVAKKGNKSIQFISTGDDTEIDRNMVDVIAEPLIHMVRNAADHGIEAPAVREKAGKPSAGTIRLNAYHSGGSVVIDLTDDGAGLDKERILAKAIQKGLVESNKTFSEAEIFQFIFLPGFSTTENVTDISGRGVGMDVVRRSIEKLKGRIEISSEKGHGTVFRIVLPLTLAITDGMIVRVGSERYIIPTVSIAMNFRPEASHLSSVVGRGEVILLRDEIIPLFRLYQLFGVKAAVEDPTRGLVVVLRDGGNTCGLLVDELLGQHQVVSKSLGSGVRQLPAVSGGAILGDGRVGLVLDPGNLIAFAKSSGSKPTIHEGRGAPHQTMAFNEMATA